MTKTIPKKPFNPAALTTAPYQFSKRRNIPFTPEKIWPVIADHKGMTT